MSLPSYIVNFDELAEMLKEYFQDGIRVDLGGITVDTSTIENLLEELKDKIQGIEYKDLIDALNVLNTTLLTVGGQLGIAGRQKIYGQVLEIPAALGEYLIEFTVPKRAAITSISYSQSSWRYQDNWNLKINNEEVFRNVYTKEVGETKYFNKFREINAGDKIKFIYNNNSASSKVIWVDFALLEGEV